MNWNRRSRAAGRAFHARLRHQAVCLRTCQKDDICQYVWTGGGPDGNFPWSSWARPWCGLQSLYTVSRFIMDFSGYSDMAIGLGRMFGFTYQENFNFLYLSASVSEFWRRWHISLSTWFKQYLYIPLGGNRKGLNRTCVNLFVVFLATGLWHGASMNFICWASITGYLSWRSVCGSERFWIRIHIRC